MKKIPVILDGDPGHDDAIAWMIAAASPLLDIKAVTTVAGNKDIHNVTNNARKVCELFGIQAPLAQGATGPLVAAGITAGDFHGKTGLDGVELPVAGVGISDLAAVELMATALKESEDPVVMIGTGAETNLATLLLYRPELKKKIRAFYLMGGGIEMGNWNPAAEFNILVDPEAAKIVFASGVPIVMNGLDVTERALIFPDEIDRLRAIGSPLSHIVACWLDFFGGTHQAMGYTGWPLHDPCAVLSLTDAGLFTMKDACLKVETGGAFCRGATLADFEDSAHYNAKVVLDVNREAFVEKLIETVQFYGEECGKPKAAAEPANHAAISIETEKARSVSASLVYISAEESADAIHRKILDNAPCRLLLKEGPGSLALALKVWPELRGKIPCIYYAGGTLERGDATAWAEKSVYEESEKVESLLNTGIPVIFATLEAAEARGLTMAELAEKYAACPENYETFFCGIHVEFQSGALCRGRLICDRKSDHKFEKKNAGIIV